MINFRITPLIKAQLKVIIKPHCYTICDGRKAWEQIPGNIEHLFVHFAFVNMVVNFVQNHTNKILPTKFHKENEKKQYATACQANMASIRFNAFLLRDNIIRDKFEGC